MRRNKLWILILATIAAFAVLIVSTSRTYFSNGDSGKSIVVILKTNDPRSDFWQAVSSGAKAAAKESEAKVDIRGPLTEADTNTQVRLLEAAIREKPNVIVLAPADEGQLLPLIAEARKADIGLVVMNSPLQSPEPQSFVLNNDLKAGKLAGIAMNVQASQRSRLAILSDFPNSAVTKERMEGVLQELATVPTAGLDTFYTGNSEDKAYQAVRTLISEHNDVNGIVALNEAATLGAAKAIKEMNLQDQVRLIGFDSSVYEVQLLEQDVIKGIVVEKPFNMGYLAVKTAFDVLHKHKPVTAIRIDPVVVTKDNMHLPEIQRLLFPFVDY